MEEIKQFITNIQENSVTYWLGAMIGALLIVGLRSVLIGLVNKRLEGKKRQHFMKKIINWSTAFAMIVYLMTYLLKSSVIYETLFVFGVTRITIFLILTIVFALILALKFSNAIQEFLLPILYERYEVDLGLRASINTFTKYFIITLTVLIALSSIGFDLTSLTVFASVLGVGIGFGLKNVMSNFISGLIILFERPIKVGDRVIIDDTIANVEEIRIRATVVRTRKNERLIIPNAYFLEEKFINRSYINKELRVSVDIDVAYGSDVELVEKLLLETVTELKNEKWPNILDEPKPRVFFENFGDSGLAFSIWFWINSQADEREFRIPSDLRFKIVGKFDEHGIEIPFPQQDVHIIPND